MQLIRGIDGVKIAVYDPNPCGKREVLMVHGWPLSAKMYEYQERLLLEHGFRVVTMDLPGFGRSDAPACGYSYDCLSDAVYAVVKSLGLCRFVLGFFHGRSNCLAVYAAPSWIRCTEIGPSCSRSPKVYLFSGFSTWDGAIPSGSAY